MGAGCPSCCRSSMKVVPLRRPGKNQHLNLNLTGRHNFEIYSLRDRRSVQNALQRAVVVCRKDRSRVYLEPMSGAWKAVPSCWLNTGTFKSATREQVLHLYQLQCTAILAKQRQRLVCRVDALQKRLEESESHRRQMVRREMESQTSKWTASISLPESDPGSSVFELQQRIVSLEQEADKSLCKICFESELDTLLNPCCHLVVCSQCAQDLTWCPACRQLVTSTTLVYRT